jgi:hypothetical protein
MEPCNDFAFFRDDLALIFINQFIGKDEFPFLDQLFSRFDDINHLGVVSNDVSDIFIGEHHIGFIIPTDLKLGIDSFGSPDFLITDVAELPSLDVDWF